MINKRKKKLEAILVLLTVLIVSFSGCGEVKGSNEKAEAENSDSQTETKDSDSQTETKDSDSQAGAESSGTEKSWEEKAKITLGDTIVIHGSGAEELKHVITISEGGSYEITGTLADGTIYIETDEAVRLVLNEASLTSTDGSAIYVADAQEVWIELAAGTENILADASEYQEETESGAIFSDSDLIFTGSGSLTVTGNYKHAVCGDSSVSFEDGTYELSAVKDGVHVKDALVVNGGSIQVTQANDGMESEGTLEFNGGTYLASVSDDGMTAAGNLTVNGGEITVMACEEGLESKGNLYVNGGMVEITGNNDGINGDALVQISDGMIYINTSAGDGVDSNGELKMDGGVVIAFGGNAPEGGADCDENVFTITGGILIAAGGVNSAPSETSCTQAAALLGAAAEGESIGIKDADGKLVFAFQVLKSYSNLLLSGEFLEEEGSYTVYTGGEISGEETFHGYYANAEYEGGTESITFTVDGMVISAGGTAGMQGGMPGGRTEEAEGQFPQDGEKPQMPGNGQMPQMPESGEMPQMPESGEMPQMPGDGEMTPGTESPTLQEEQSETDDSL